MLPNDRAVARGRRGRGRSGARTRGCVSVVSRPAPRCRGWPALAVHDPLRRFDDDVIAMTERRRRHPVGQLEVAAEEAVTTPASASRATARPDRGRRRRVGADLARSRPGPRRMLSGGGELVTLIPGPAAPERSRRDRGGGLPAPPGRRGGGLRGRPGALPAADRGRVAAPTARDLPLRVGGPRGTPDRRSVERILMQRGMGVDTCRPGGRR